MTARSISRAAFLAALTSAFVLTAAPEASAARNPDAEEYVQSSATGVLQMLNNRAMAATARRQTFHSLMSQFADMPRIANYVLGRYGAALRADAQLRADWNRTFQEYSIAVYEDRLDTYSTSVIRVTGSIERVPGRDVIVMSEMTPRGQSRPSPVQWRLMRTGDVWKVVDVSLVLEGSEIWMAQQQQREFLARLDRNNGDIRALLAEVQQLTARTRARMVARG